MTEIKLTTDIPEWTALHCPVCDEPNLHQSTLRVFDRQEDADFTRITQVSHAEVVVKTVASDDCGNPSSRRQGLSIDFWCEHCNDRPLTLHILQHKGTTFLRWDVGDTLPEIARFAEWADA